MTQRNDEFSRMQKIAGILNENQNDNPTHKSKVNWYYVGDHIGVIPKAEGYDLNSYPNKELYMRKGTKGWVNGNRFEDEEGNDVPFEVMYFEKI